MFLSVGAATGASFKWPDWLPVRINAIGIEWADFNNDPGRFVIVLSVSVTKLPSASSLEFSGAINGVKIDPFLLLEGKFPIIDIESFAVQVSGDLFGGKVTAGLVGGILKLDANGSIIDAFDAVTPVADRVLFGGITGGFELAGIGPDHPTRPVRTRPVECADYRQCARRDPDRAEHRPDPERVHRRG